MTSITLMFVDKHASNLLFIIDEGDVVPDKVYRRIEFCISGGNARLLVMLNHRAAYVSHAANQLVTREVDQQRPEPLERLCCKRRDPYGSRATGSRP